MFLSFTTLVSFSETERLDDDCSEVHVHPARGGAALQLPKQYRPGPSCKN